MEEKREEKSGWKTRLKESKDNSENIKILFMYPNNTKPTVHRGKVVAVYDDCFSFKDIYDGILNFSYNFIAEIKKWDGSI